MDMDFLLLLSFIMCLASFIQGSIGFGFPMVATAFMSLFTDIQTAIFFTLIPATFLNIVSIKSEGKFLEALRKYYPFALLSIIGSSVGMWLLLTLDSQIFKVFLALMILFYLFINKLNLNLNLVEKSPNKSLWGFGILTGLVGGLTNAMAPIFLMYSLEAKYTRAMMIQAGNITFLSLKVVQIILFGVHGQLSNIEFGFSSSVLLAVALFFYLGNKIKKRININTYTKLIKILLFIISFGLLGQAFF